MLFRSIRTNGRTKKEYRSRYVKKKQTRKKPQVQTQCTQIQVQIIQMSACSSCHAKGACTAADMDEKFIDVESDDTSLKVGDMVDIVGESSTGLFAVLLAFVIPFMLILTSLFFLRNIVLT